jgi:hypothetical protein
MNTAIIPISGFSFTAVNSRFITAAIRFVTLGWWRNSADARSTLRFSRSTGIGPKRRVAGNLDGAEAAELAHDIGARWVIPCHYEMFEFNTADPQTLFVPTCRRLGQACAILKVGESWMPHVNGRAKRD